MINVYVVGKGKASFLFCKKKVFILTNPRLLKKFYANRILLLEEILPLLLLLPDLKAGINKRYNYI